jgi:hypothetical protein
MKLHLGILSFLLFVSYPMIHDPGHTSPSAPRRVLPLVVPDPTIRGYSPKLGNGLLTPERMWQGMCPSTKTLHRHNQPEQVHRPVIDFALPKAHLTHLLGPLAPFPARCVHTLVERPPKIGE